ncbi:hypothetical protein [Brevundimonas sp.]|uniref:hypothetical protein n=1 Tax=Brevundimonas sp. TaxID=1871086 RepID=UPI002FC593CD
MIHFHDLSGETNEQIYDWIVEIASDIRSADADEIRATNPCLAIGDPDFVRVLMMSVMVSNLAFVITKSDKPFCIFGAGPDDTGDGVIWMIGTSVLEHDRAAKMAVGRQTNAVMELFLAFWPRLHNHVDARNQQSIMWLLNAGFGIENVELKHGREQRPFYLISKTKEPHV